MQKIWKKKKVSNSNRFFNIGKKGDLSKSLILFFNSESFEVCKDDQVIINPEIHSKVTLEKEGLLEEHQGQTIYTLTTILSRTDKI